MYYCREKQGIQRERGQKHRKILQNMWSMKEKGPRTTRSGRREKPKSIHPPVAEIVVAVETPEAQIEVVPETALAVAAVVPPALATTLPPAMAELAATVALAEAGQEAADGNFTLTLGGVLVSELRFMLALGVHSLITELYSDV